MLGPHIASVFNRYCILGFLTTAGARKKFVVWLGFLLLQIYNLALWKRGEEYNGLLPMEDWKPGTDSEGTFHGHQLLVIVNSLMASGMSCLCIQAGLNQLCDWTQEGFFSPIILSGTFDLCFLPSVLWCMVHFLGSAGHWHSRTVSIFLNFKSSFPAGSYFVKFQSLY